MSVKKTSPPPPHILNRGLITQKSIQTFVFDQKFALIGKREKERERARARERKREKEKREQTYIIKGGWLRDKERKRESDIK